MSNPLPSGVVSEIFLRNLSGSDRPGITRDLSGILRAAAQRNELFPLPPMAVRDAVEELYRRGLFIAAEPDTP